MEPSLVRKPSLQGNLKHKSMSLSSQETPIPPSKRERSHAKHQGKELS